MMNTQLRSEIYPFKKEIVPERSRPIIIGEGATGKVFLTFRKERVVYTNYYAHKEIIPNCGNETLSQIDFDRQVIYANKISHPAIAKVISNEEIPIENQPGNKVYIVETNLYPNGDLYTLLQCIRQDPRSQPSKWDINKKIELLYGIASGLNAIHSHCGDENDDDYYAIVHRDLRTPNIMLDVNLRPKISDFGCARVLSNESQATFDRTRVNYAAPEMLDATDIFDDPRTKLRYARSMNLTTKVDIFAYGMICYAVLSGQEPFNECNEDEEVIKQKIRNNVFPPIPESFLPIQKENSSNITELFTTIIRKCWEKDPNDRPTAQEIMEQFEDEFINEKWFNEVAEYYRNTDQEYDDSCTFSKIKSAAYTGTDFAASLYIAIMYNRYGTYGSDNENDATVKDFLRNVKGGRNIHGFYHNEMQRSQQPVHKKITTYSNGRPIRFSSKSGYD